MSRNETITLVVVCYERELNMLALLARSVATHASDDLLTEILIIDNSIGQPDFAHRIEARAMSEFGRFRTRAKILSATDLGVVVAGTGGGYTSQQALKLEVSRVVSTDYYLLFDAKNHLATRLDASELFAADGRPLAERTIHTDYLAACQRASFEFWGATAAPEAPTLPTVTPYLMVTHVVRRMLDEIESRGRSVQETIAEDTKRTEFLLYAGYLERDGAVDTTYGSRSRASATLYARWPQDNPTIERVIASAGTAGAYAMGVHARRFVQLQDRHIELIARRWLDFGVVDSIESGAAFIRAEARGDETADADVLIGRGKRLSIDAGTNGLRDQHRGDRTLSDKDVAKWHDALAARTAFCHEHGAEYAMLIAPDTYSLFAEDFANFGLDSEARPVTKVLRDLHTEATVVYPLDALREARRSGIIAHTADSHWSAFGASVAYHELTSVLPGVLKEFQPDEIEFSHRVGTGDLGDKLDPIQLGEYTEARVRQARARQVWNNGVNNRGYMGLWHNEASDLPRGVLYMDSYGWKFQRFLAESFSSLLVVHTPYLEREPIEQYAPDVVLNLMAERFIIRVPDDETREPALVTAISKLPSARYPTRKEYDSGTISSDPDARPTVGRKDNVVPPAPPAALGVAELLTQAQERLRIAEVENERLRAEVARLRGWINDQRTSLSERGRKIEDLREWVGKLKTTNDELRRRVDQLAPDSASSIPRHRDRR